MQTEVTIKHGEVEMDVVGGQGSACQEKTQPYRALASGEPVEVLKDEFHVQERLEEHE